ncbi:MFS transporter [Nocardiopsis sp. N85]|uniref:MFS transporter n=1 Tax=Nocardiopsis sp. N85 TaxID=3029400 RepID=UPI00237F7ECC|nr:MFS transporter [Nocardiopsis sp. N85]MDE3720815.1 MFS transporter [Nocardiopsis sp. N85]
MLRRYVLFSLGSTTADFAFGAVFVTVLLARGIDPLQLGTLLAASAVFGLAAEAPSGALGDRYGHRRLLASGLVVWGVGFVLFGWADGVPVTLLGTVLWAVGFHLHSGALTALVVNRIGTRDRAVRIARVVRWGQIGSRFGGVLGGVTVMLGGTWLSGDALILVAGAMLVALGLAVPLSFPMSPGRRGVSVGALVRESVTTLAGRRFAPLVVLVVGLTVVKAVLVMSWQPLVTARYGDDVRINGMVLLVMTFALALGAACSRFLGHRNPHLWGSACVIATGVPLFLVAWDLLPPVVALILAEFLLGVSQALFVVWEHLMYSDAARNALFSTMSFVALAVLSMTHVLFGWAWDGYGLETAMTVVLVVSVVAAAATAPLAFAFPESRRFFDPGGRAERGAPGDSEESDVRE